MQSQNEFKIRKARIGYIEKNKNGDIIFKYVQSEIGKERIYVIDEKKSTAIDIDLLLSYPYIHTMNMQYIKEGQNLERFSPEDRIVCCSFGLSFNSLSGKQLKNIEYIVESLRKNLMFPDGNKEMDNTEFVELMQIGAKKEHKDRAKEIKKEMRKGKKY